MDLLLAILICAELVLGPFRAIPYVPDGTQEFFRLLRENEALF